MPYHTVVIHKLERLIACYTLSLPTRIRKNAPIYQDPRQYNEEIAFSHTYEDQMREIDRRCGEEWRKLWLAKAR
jgi:hypothetical protein